MCTDLIIMLLGNIHMQTWKRMIDASTLHMHMHHNHTTQHTHITYNICACVVYYCEYTEVLRCGLFQTDSDSGVAARAGEAAATATAMVVSDVCAMAVAVAVAVTTAAGAASALAACPAAGTARRG